MHILINEFQITHKLTLEIPEIFQRINAGINFNRWLTMFNERSCNREYKNTTSTILEKVQYVKNIFEIY